MWNTILPGLEKVTAHSYEEDLPEEIRVALEQGIAWLFLCFEEDQYKGFAVIKPEANCLGKKGLHIWLTYYNGKTFEQHINEVAEMAKAEGFSQLTFSSPRKGWARRLKDWQPTYQVYKREL